MAFDFNAFHSARPNAFRDSAFNARGRANLFLGASQSGGTINYPAGIIGDSIQFYAFSPTFPLPSFRFRGGLVGDPDDGWGRKSFTIRQWWKAGNQGFVLGPSIHGQFRTAFAETFFVQPNTNRRDIDAPVGGALVVNIPTIRFGVWTGAVFEEVSYHFFQSPETSGGPLTGIPGGIVGPLIEMTEDTWHRTIVWYDEHTLQIGLQLDDLTPETAILTGPIPAGPTQGLFYGETTPVGGDFDYSFDEWGLWHNYVWTAGERNADWNGGAGTGWPGVLSAISKQPMAYWRFEAPDDYKPEGIQSML